jgi:hypothetical protein
MFKKVFFLGLTVGIMASVAAIIYNRVYHFALEADFSKLVNTGSIIGANIAVGLLAAIGYWFMKKWWKNKAENIFNFTLTILSFASILIPISATLPLDINTPELFPGLTVPMHFFPALAWFTLKPLFIKESITSVNNQ